MYDQIPSSLATGDPRVFAVVAGIAALLLFWGLVAAYSRAKDPALRRLNEIASGTGQSPGSTWGQQIAALLKPVERFVLPGDTERDGTRLKLMFAGYRSTSAISTYYVAKLVLVVGMLCLWMVVARYIPSLTSGRIWFFGLGAAFLGTLLPSIWLDRRVTHRHKLLRNGFPDALDLLTVCVESGLGLTQALQRVADELQVSHPELAGELEQVTSQMRAGVDREAALRALATRTGLDDIRGLVSLLAQTLRFGTGIAEALRVYSDDFRDRRMQRAEEIAAKMGTKLIFPLVVCLFPSFFVVAIGPAVIRMMAAFSGK